MGIESKLERYLSNSYTPLNEEDEGEDIIGRLVMFVTSLDVNKLDDEQAAELDDIMGDIEGSSSGAMDDESEEEGLEEGRKIKKIKSSARREHKIYYKANKSRLKMLAKKYRRSSKGKLLARKAAKMSKRGKTATGKRQVTYR
jgi:hypothetical protein